MSPWDCLLSRTIQYFSNAALLHDVGTRNYVICSRHHLFYFKLASSRPSHSAYGALIPQGEGDHYVSRMHTHEVQLRERAKPFSGNPTTPHQLLKTAQPKANAAHQSTMRRSMAGPGACNYRAAGGYHLIRWKLLNPNSSTAPTPSVVR